MNPLASLTLSLAFATLASAQTVWTVPPAGDVQGAINAAVPGDIIELQAGRHWRFHLDKGLTITGDGVIGEHLTATPSLVTIDVPDGQVARFSGITHASTMYPASSLQSSGAIEIHGGKVVFEDCSLTGGSYPYDANGLPAATVNASNAEVVFVRSHLGGTGRALVTENSHVAMSSTSFYGGTAPPQGIVECGGSGSLHASDVDFGVPFANGGPLVVTHVETWIVDSTFENGLTDLLVCTGPTTLARNTFARVPTSTGQDIVGSVVTDSGLLGVRTTAPATRGSNYTVTFQAGSPLVSVVALGTFDDLAGPFDLPFASQPLWTSNAFVFATGVTGPSGAFDVSVAVPTRAGLQHERFDVHGARLSAGRIEFAPVVPAVVR